MATVAVQLAGDAWDSGYVWGALTVVLVWGLRETGMLGSKGDEEDAAGVLTMRPHMRQLPGPADEYNHAPFTHDRVGEAAMRHRASSFLSIMKTRRSVRFFSPDSVPLSVVETCVQTAGTSPSGAHCQVRDTTIRAHSSAL